MKKNVLIIGIGLIGGSIMKAIHEGSKHQVFVYDTDKETIDYCLENKYIKETFSNLKEAVKVADVIILAAPITASISILKEIDQMQLEKDIIITDVSSVKTTIFQVAAQLENPHIKFIGGHPMAGSHKNGVSAAKAHLFENAIYVLTPMQESSDADIEVLKDILEPTKSKFLILNPEEHDEMTSVTSHFPHLIAASLVQ